MQKMENQKEERFDKWLCSLNSTQLPLCGLENAREKKKQQQ